ncbi:hypothetical protein P4S72_02065 [Vibrio sp. PP-XX7]
MASSLSLANQLVGNPDNTAAIELMFGGGQFRFTSATWFALTGCECHATLQGSHWKRAEEEPLDGSSEQSVMAGWRYPVTAGQTLTLHTPSRGLCAYLAIAGGSG